MGENKNIYSVYIHTNKVDGRKYVGITRKKPNERWHKNGSGYMENKPFWDDIQLLGWNEGFTHEVVATELTSYEAAKMEIDLIQKYDSFRNGYNRSLGGEGMEGYVVGSPIRERMSPEVYAEWSAKNAERMKRLGIERTRKVISLTDNRIYNSAVEVSQSTGIPVARVRDMCNRNRRTRFCDTNGYYYRFCWYDKKFDITQDEFTVAYYPNAVICLETQQIFAGSQEAGRVMDIPSNQISQVCRGKWITAHGYKFVYYREYVYGKRDTRVSKNIEKNRHEVICLETGGVYYNCAEASEAFGCSSNMINRAIHNFQYTCKGYHFADYNDYKENPNKYILPEVVDKTVMRFDKFGKFIEEYKNYQSAAKALNVNETNVHASCTTGKSKRFICADSLWMFKRDYTPKALYDKVQAFWNTIKNYKCIGQYSLDGELLNIYDSVTSASKNVGCTPTPIAQCCKGKKNIIKGYKWEYISPLTYLDKQEKIA